jgi:homoserine O-acetyltransferase
VNGLPAALYTLITMGTSPLQLQKQAPTKEAADALFDETFKKRLAAANGMDMLYQVDSSRDYNPEPYLESIRAPLTAINSADDQVNPPELGVMEKQIVRVKQGRYVLIPISGQTRGHSTHSLPAVWGQHLADLLQRSAPQPTTSRGGR